MSIPVLTFFNNKGGVGKTSLVYHLSSIFSEMGKRVVAIDLDPQANLTSAFLAEDKLEELWDPDLVSPKPLTIYRCVQPLMEVGDIQEPITQRIRPSLHLVPGDLALAGFEDFLSQEWPNSLGSGNLLRAFRVLTAFWTVAQKAAAQVEADLILADVGPNLGAINRSALIGSDYVVIPLAADLFSLQGLRNLGPTLRHWRSDWSKRLDNWSSPSFPLPKGKMAALGYIVQQHSEGLSRPVKAYDRWAARIPGVYRQSVLLDNSPPPPMASDPLCLARLKHYRSLVPMAQEARKPIFRLTSADGAIGSHSYAVQEARNDFSGLAQQILDRIEAES
jgi:cellulose biosynthesis protein BcsQ